MSLKLTVSETLRQLSMPSFYLASIFVIVFTQVSVCRQILASLHWLPVTFQMDVKMLLSVFKALHGLAPSDLSDLLNGFTPARLLRSADQTLPAVLRSTLQHRGGRVFPVTASKLSKPIWKPTFIPWLLNENEEWMNYFHLSYFLFKSSHFMLFS